MRAALGLVLATSTTAVGCASSPRAQAQADMATFQRESTTDKLVERGKAFASVGDMTRAEEYLTAALDRGADPREVLPLLLQVCIQTGRYRSAIQHAEEHLRKHPDDVNTRFVLGTLYAALGESKDARDELERVLAILPEEARVHYALAVLARDAENDAIGADHHFREYLRLDPSGKHAEEARASLLQRMP